MSIKKIFRNFKLSIIVVLVFLSGIAYSFVSVDFDVVKINHLQQLHTQSLNLLDLNQDEKAMQLLRLKEHLTTMQITLDEVNSKRTYDYVERYLFSPTLEEKHLQMVQNSLDDLSKATIHYYKEPTTKGKELLHINQTHLKEISDLYSKFLVQQIEKKNKLFFFITLANALNILLIILWYARRLSHIYSDILLLLSVDKGDKKRLYTQEGILIDRRMSRGGVALGSKSLLDPLTEILNEKGLHSEFAHRDNSSTKEQLGVTIFDVDNLKELELAHGKPFTDTVLKKVAFILNLEKKSSDIIARIGDDEFVSIVSRPDKEQAYACAENIRQQIEKVKFKTPKSGKISVTISGGFAVKDKYDKLDVAMHTANSLLKRAKLQGRNNITKLHDFDSDKNSRM